MTDRLRRVGHVLALAIAFAFSGHSLAAQAAVRRFKVAVDVDDSGSGESANSHAKGRSPFLATALSPFPLVSEHSVTCSCEPPPSRNHLAGAHGSRDVLLGLESAPISDRRRLSVGRPDLNHDVGMRGERNGTRVACEGFAVDPHFLGLAFGEVRGGGGGPSQRLPPHREEVPQGERSIQRCFDVDEPIGCVGVQPVDAALPAGLADVGRDVDCLAVVQYYQMLVNVNPLPFLRVTGDAANGLASWRERLRQRPGRRYQPGDERERPDGADS